ncbi:Alpha/Beta hydrolase protein [Dendryphion nanum]|uniref:Alpha/Beta hydrolase protein n=1 Tax=Dendryphion nanum TaxID=256645 RepID=A0A9P9IR33_9PLEO|nr:Alpha/Beta hydrolase protein [Dendryphion nanum]
MASIKPFTIAIPDSEIDRLNQKLALASFPDEVDDAGWDYGAPLPDVKRLATYWKDTYSWRNAEAALNKLPNYLAQIEVEGFGAIDVHFLHQQSQVKNAIPLLFVHGWPGSFLEATKILPLLADSEKNGGPAFHVIAPSLPNFGFSSSIKKKGFGQPQYAETCHKLMLALGYEKYVTQGGDWGFSITRTIGQLYPTHVGASHINIIPAYPPSPKSPLSFLKFLSKYFLSLYSAAEFAGLERTQDYQKKQAAYYEVQSKNPMTIGYALADSPVATLAWIYEKLVIWTDGYEWGEEEVCTWMSVYWFATAGPASSVRIYHESTKESSNAFESSMVFNKNIPLGLSYFPREVCLLPEDWAHSLGPIVYSKRHDKGGHFAAYEVPEKLVGDLRIMFGKGGPAFGVVEGRDGLV